MQFAGEHVLEVAPVIQTRESVAQGHLPERIAQFEIGERRADAVGHRAQALFRVQCRTSGACAHVDGNMKQAEDLALTMDGHADVACGVVVRMPAPNRALARGEMGVPQPQRPAFLRHQGLLRRRPAAPGSHVLEHVARLAEYEERSVGVRKQLRAGFAHDRISLTALRAGLQQFGHMRQVRTVAVDCLELLDRGREGLVVAAHGVVGLAARRHLTG